MFDGTKREPYVESDSTGPLSAYGRSKLAGEGDVAARRARTRHTIVRSSWLFGAGGRCFPATILRLAAERDEMTVVDDQVGCPTFTGHLAARARRAVARARPQGSCTSRARGRARGSSWRGRSSPPPGSTARSSRGRTADMPRPATRPAYSVLGTERRGQAPALPDWRRRARAVHGAGGAGAMKLLVCGGAGFIGSTFVRVRVREHGDEVTVLDKLTYAGRRENLHDVIDEIRFLHGAIEDPAAVADAVAGCDAIVNFAAETHVDRSIAGPEAFIMTNMQGTHVLLEAARERGLRYLQVSTDEVYGSIEEGSFTESSPLEPSSPYSATKTGADLLVGSYFHTYGLEAVICRGSNNYGPYQYPEKMIPLMILNALAGDPLPVYGDGRNVRNWLFVEDFARGIGHALAHGAPGEVYNCGGPDECENIEVVKQIVELSGADESLIEFVTDRPGHDRRYSLSSREAEGARLGAAGAVRRRPRADRGVVSGQRLVVGADPIGRLPRVLRAPVRPGAQALSSPVADSLAQLEREVISCRRCPRLVAWREEVARVKRAAYASERLLGAAAPGIRRSCGARARARARPGGPRRQPHRPDLHR